MATAAALARAAAPACANAASPVLEFVPSGGSFPVSFTAEGGIAEARLGEFNRIVECSHSEGSGEITGPRTTLSSYIFTGCKAEIIGGGGSPLKCKSAGAGEEEIKSEPGIEADLVYLNQAEHKVAMLLNPGGGTYMEFECEGTSIKAGGPFLASVESVNKLASSFTAILERNGNSQVLTEYEDLNGVKHQAIPMAEVNGEAPDMSGVSLTFAIQPSVPLEIKAVSTAEIEAKQHEEEAAKKRQQDEAAAKKHQEEEAAAKKRQEDEAAALTAKKRQEEAAAKARKQKLTKALKQCKKVKPKSKRAQCVKRANKKYGPLKAGGKP